MYGLLGKLQAKQGSRDELSTVLLEAAKLVSMAKGCISYVVNTSDTDKNCVWVYEVWESKDDHAQSLNAPGVKELISTALPLLEGPPQREHVFNVLGGKGV